MLIRLWAENFDHLESKDTQKAWDDIAKKMNEKVGTRDPQTSTRRTLKWYYDQIFTT